MAMNGEDTALFAALASAPEPTAGWITIDEHNNTLYALVATKQRTPAQAELAGAAGGDARHSLVTYRVDKGGEGKGLRPPPFSMPHAGVKLASPSRSGKYLAVVRDAGGAQVIEVSRGGRLVARYSPDAKAPQHGAIYTDAWFGGLAWFKSESALVFVAERVCEGDKAERRFFAATGESADADAAGSGSAALPGAHEYRCASQRGSDGGRGEDWGETYCGKASPTLFVLHLPWHSGSGFDFDDLDTLALGCRVAPVPGIPPHISAGQPSVYQPAGKDGSCVLFAGWYAAPRRLGMTYCYQRPCAVYLARLCEDDPAYVAECLTPDVSVARSPRLLSNTHFAYLASADDAAPCHNNCFRLCTGCLPWSPGAEAAAGAAYDARHNELLGIVEVPGAPGAFPGMYGGPCLPRALDGPMSKFSGFAEWIICQTVWGCFDAIIAVSCAGDGVERLAPAGRETANYQLLDVRMDETRMAGTWLVLVAHSTPLSPHVVELWRVKRGLGNKKLEVFECDVAPAPQLPRGAAAKLAAASWEVLRVDCRGEAGDGGAGGGAGGGGRTPAENPKKRARTAAHGDDPAPAAPPPPPHACEAILLRPGAAGAGTAAQPPPLVAMPHGGPHSATTCKYTPTAAFVCVAGAGAAVLHVNYRGSLGQGRAALQSLLGRCGGQDVADVDAAVGAALAQGAGDPGRVSVVGGSHGGFLGAHMVAQHPGRYRAACLRNPVTDIASMVHRTDIPDWCFVECGLPFDFERGAKVPSAEELLAMRAASPIARLADIRAPVLLLLGERDRRVPPSVGLDFYHQLRAHGGGAARTDTRIMRYPKDTHAIDTPGSEADAWLHVLLFLRQHAFGPGPS
eukprot:g2715.t1